MTERNGFDHPLNTGPHTLDPHLSVERKVGRGPLGPPRKQSAKIFETPIAFPPFSRTVFNHLLETAQ